METKTRTIEPPQAPLPKGTKELVKRGLLSIKDALNRVPTYTDTGRWLLRREAKKGGAK